MGDEHARHSGDQCYGYIHLCGYGLVGGEAEHDVRREDKQIDVSHHNGILHRGDEDAVDGVSGYEHLRGDAKERDKIEDGDASGAVERHPYVHQHEHRGVGALEEYVERA